jgi:GH43 family beta-xylosidase
MLLGINEGPQWLSSPDGNFVGIVYSCAGSWTRDYKLGVLQYQGGDPLNPHSWHKWKQPLLQSGGHAHCHGPGHCSFLPVGQDMVVIFHATDKPTDGWENRKARAQVLEWKSGPIPDMGGHVGNMCDSLHGDQPVPSGPGGPGPSAHPSGGHGKHQGLMDKVKSKVEEAIDKVK